MPSPKHRPSSFPRPTAAAAADIGDRAARATGSGAGLIRAAIMDPIAELTEPGDRGPGPDRGTAAAMAGIVARTAPAIRSGEGPSRAAITALITPKSAPFSGRMAYFARISAASQALEAINGSFRETLRPRQRGRPGRHPGVRRPRIGDEAHYTCSGGGKLSANFSQADAAKGEVKLTFDTGRELSLPQVLSADGGRYANAGIEFWIKGQSATLTMNGVKETCSTQ